MRWNIYAEKDQLFINKKGDKVIFKTLNVALLDEIKKDLQKISPNQKYLKDVRFLNPDQDNNSVGLEVTLSGPEVELFSFYKDREQRYVVDFWKEKDEVKTLDAAVQKDVPVTSAQPIVEQKAPAELPPVLIPKNDETPVAVAKPVVSKKKVEKLPEYRDFRYGASFVWDYAPFAPSFEPLLDITRKAPEFLYPIPNRKFDKDEKEAHLQLTINLYRKKNYGLMNKSIELYQKKYGDTDNWEIIEYLKANAIIKDNIDQGNRDIPKIAVNMLSNLIEKSTTYDLKKAVIKYLITYYQTINQPLDVLNLTKTYYVITKENFDIEESQVALEGILASLGKLNQVEQIREVAADKTAGKLVPKQILLGHELYSLLTLGLVDDAIKAYESMRKGLAKPIHPSILFNAAEAYFRRAKYNEALALFDQFISEHSYHTRSQDARVRLGLIYELMGKNPIETLVLYKNAINRSNNFAVQYEARLRYVALRTVRKLNPNKEDLETRVFLDINDSQQKDLNQNLKKTLWLVRLRSFINDKKFHDALSYLSALPLTSMNLTERRVFESDGAEVIYGIIAEHFSKGNYSQVVRIWENYRKDYVEKVANDPFVNFVVGKSLIRLGLYEAFDKIYQDFEKLSETPSKTFPVWLERVVDTKRSQFILELDLIKNIKLANYEAALKRVDDLERMAPAYNLVNFYRGVINFKKNDYKQAISHLETYISMANNALGFDPSDVSEMMTAYTDSLYQVNDLEKFQKVAEAVLSDTKNYAPSNPFINNMRERLSYYQIELFAGKKDKESSLMLEKLIPSFTKSYPKSVYSSRVNYLYGQSLIINMKLAEGRTLLEKMLGDANVDEPIKELIRSELTLLTIKERTLKTE
ncbi:MAG: hypothetical protein OHK0056_15200 [Bacteriovoracaceae bacterium]